ncbi:YceD family protein [Pelistega ratti]|uniref:YceD family protein n=1 Tax=Pelistega ratti TaxID=2652177 RepID=UPI0013587DE4|nr:YceD family protein [Pelistega ratti]
MDKYIDLMDLVRLSQEVQGSADITAFNRLSEDLPQQTTQTQVEWHITGHQKPHGPALIQLQIKANPQLQCQRCMKLFHYPIATEVELEAVTSQKALDADVADSGEIDSQAYEKILAHQPVNIIELVEDELILSLPYIPKHEVCQDLVELPEDNLAKKPSPFAILEKLKH